MAKRIVLITGANQGLGLEIAKKLAAENENYLLLMAIRDITKGEQAIKSITQRAKNTSLETLLLDVSNDESITKAAEEVDKKHGHLDVLLNNAGIVTDKNSGLRDEMLKVYSTNVAGVAVVTEAFVPLLKKSKSAPRVVIMSSDVGSIANTLDPNYAYYFIDNIPYKTSKAAVNMVGAVLSKRLWPEGIRVNLVNPGYRATNLNNYSKIAGRVEDGAIEACKYVVMGDEGETATYTELEGPIRW